MKDNFLIAALCITGIVVLFSLVYGMRLFSNATTPITVHEVESGIKCATMVTGDGAAIDCWKIDD